jgi:DNA-binding response OmpR family regulator
MLAPTPNSLSPDIQHILNRLRAIKHDDTVVDDAIKLIEQLASKSELVTVSTVADYAERRGVRVKLSPHQATALKLLADNFPRIVTIREFADAIWAQRARHRSDKTLRVMMSSLRDRVEQPLKISILNHHGLGYRLELDPENYK